MCKPSSAFNLLQNDAADGCGTQIVLHRVGSFAACSLPNGPEIKRQYWVINHTTWRASYEIDISKNFKLELSAKVFSVINQAGPPRCPIFVRRATCSLLDERNSFRCQMLWCVIHHFAELYRGKVLVWVNYLRFYLNSLKCAENLYYAQGLPRIVHVKRFYIYIHLLKFACVFYLLLKSHRAWFIFNNDYILKKTILQKAE